jgi:hypothetical protein
MIHQTFRRKEVGCSHWDDAAISFEKHDGS